MLLAALVISYAVAVLGGIGDAGATCKNGVAGICGTPSSCSNSGGRLSPGNCNGGNDNVCCLPPTSDDNVAVPPSISTGAGAYSGLAFPLQAGSLGSISVNWGGSRSSGRRCHAGIDLYTAGNKRVQAIDNGVVTAVMRGWYGCSGGSIDAILVYHPSGALAGMTVNYGEVNPGTYSVRVGSTVSQGDVIGTATRCGMLHMELYNQRVAQNYAWYPRNGRVTGSNFNGCAVNSLASRPRQLEDPRPLVRATQPSGARFHAGTSFLNDEADDSLAADEAAIADAETGASSSEAAAAGSLSGGVIAAIVIVVLIVVALAVGAAAFFVIRRRAAQLSVVEASTGTIAMNSESPAVAGGSFVCDKCQKSYSNTEDLLQHVSMRH